MKRDKLLKVMRPNDDPIESLRGDGVDLSAPGHKILAITSDNRNAKSHGTSFSAALVSGAVALMRAGFPGLDPETVERIILEAAAVRREVPGGRRLDIERALANAGLQ